MDDFQVFYWVKHYEKLQAGLLVDQSFNLSFIHNKIIMNNDRPPTHMKTEEVADGKQGIYFT